MDSSSSCRIILTLKRKLARSQIRDNDNDHDNFSDSTKEFYEILKANSLGDDSVSIQIVESSLISKLDREPKRKRRKVNSVAITPADKSTTHVRGKPKLTKELRGLLIPSYFKHYYVCNKCCAFSETKRGHKFHKEVCELKGRGCPGSCVYKDGPIEIYEVESETSYEDHLFCFHLQDLSTKYVSSQSGWAHVEHFLYYVLYVGGKVAGYFSTGKSLTDERNLSILVILPQHQNMGLGKLLVAFSYEISKIDKKIGTPERPFSENGFKCFLSYWKEQLLQCLTSAQQKGDNVTLEYLSKQTFIHESDIKLTFQNLNCNENNYESLKSIQTLVESRNEVEPPKSFGRNKKKYTLNVNGILYSPMRERVVYV